MQSHTPTTDMTGSRKAAKFWPLALPVLIGAVFLIMDLIPELGSPMQTVAGFALGLLASVAIEQQLSRGTLDRNSEDLTQVARDVAKQTEVLASLSDLAKLPLHQRQQAETWLARYAQAMISNAKEDAFTRAAEVRVAKEITWLDKLSNRLVELGTAPPELLVGLTATSKRSIAAVAYGEHASDWWATKDGSAYFEANLAACRAGADVRRIFVEGAFSSATTRQTWVDRVSEQLSSPLQIGYLAADEDASLPDESGSDVAIFDERYLYRSTVLGRAGRSSYLSGDPSEVRVQLEDFERLWSRCERAPSRITARLRELSGRVTTVVADKTQSDDFRNLLEDPDFLREAFVRGMPPAFVKRPGAGPVHIVESEALTRFQRAVMGTAQWTEDEITKDHSDADRRVVAKGGDRQLELATPNPAGANYLILTTKSLIHHNGEPYVVGWYLPALVPAGASSTELSWVKAVIDHPPIQCTPAVPYQGVQIRVGEAAVRRNFVGPSGTAPESGS